MSEQDKGSDRILQRLMAMMVDAVNYEGLAMSIVQTFAELFNAKLCTLWRRVQQENVDRLVLSATVGVLLNPGDIIPTYNLANGSEGITAWIARRRQVCLANSYYELRYDKSKPWYGAHRGAWDQVQFEGRANQNFQCLLGLPIVYGGTDDEGKVIGVLKLESKQDPVGFSVEDQGQAERLMPFVAIALQAMMVREQHEQRRQQVLRDLTQALLRVDASTFYQELVNKTAELLRATVCSLWLVKDERSKLRLGANYGVVSSKSVPEYALNWGAQEDADIDGLTPWVLIRRRAFYGEKHEDLTSNEAWRGRWDDEQWEGDAPSKFGCLYAVPLLDAEGEPFGVLKIENEAGKPKFDAVDRATFDLMAEFIALAIELSSSLRSDIVYEFFHLLKQPVANAAMAFADLRRELSRPQPRPERTKRRLDMLAKNLDAVRIWITNVYGLATAREAAAEEPSEISVRSLLTHATQEMKKLFDDFTCDLQGVEDITLKLTPLQVKEVDAILFNILDNSFKYSAPPRDIRAQAQREGRGVHLVISDNGKGISPQDLPRVFDRYFTRGAESWPTSMGLGLSTVDRLLRELGWDRNIESEVGKGTQFHMFIPQEFAT